MSDTDNTTGGDTAGNWEMGAACGICGAWVMQGQSHICPQPSYPPYIQPSSPPPAYVQPATFPQWIDPNVLERIATGIEKLSNEKTLKDIVGTLDGEAEIAAAFRLHMMRFWSYEKIRWFCLGFLTEEDRKEHVCVICKKAFSHHEWENRCVKDSSPSHENCCPTCNGADDESEPEKCTCGEGDECHLCP